MFVPNVKMIFHDVGPQQRFVFGLCVCSDVVRKRTTVETIFKTSFILCQDDDDEIERGLQLDDVNGHSS